MISQEERNRIGDELEIKLMKEKVLPAIMPEGVKAKHIPRTLGGPDFKIIENNSNEVRIVLECKNWGEERPTEGEIRDNILDRFKECKGKEWKILVGHVNFDQEQIQKYLVKRNICYDKLPSQILPDAEELKKEEFAERLKSSLATAILWEMKKYKKECVSRMKVKIIGGYEVLFKGEARNWSINLKTRKDRWFVRSGHVVSGFRKVGPKPLDIALSLSAGQEFNMNVMIIPRQYEVFSDGIEFNSDDHQLLTENSVNQNTMEFFKGISWKL